MRDYTNNNDVRPYDFSGFRLIKKKGRGGKREDRITIAKAGQMWISSCFIKEAGLDRGHKVALMWNESEKILALRPILRGDVGIFDGYSLSSAGEKSFCISARGAISETGFSSTGRVYPKFEVLPATPANPGAILIYLGEYLKEGV